MLKRARSLRFDCQWLDCQSFYSEVAGLWRGDANVDDWLRKLNRPDVLCLSDPIVRGMTESQRATLARVVNDRWLVRRSTWVTCNARDLKWAEDQFSDRTLSRLLDGAVRIYCDWEDYRKQATPAPVAGQEGT